MGVKKKTNVPGREKGERVPVKKNRPNRNLVGEEGKMAADINLKEKPGPI